MSDLNGNTVAIQSTVTGITEQLCAANPNLVEYANLDILTGSDDKDAESDVSFALYSGQDANAQQIGNATCIEQMPTLSDDDFLNYQNGPVARGFTAAGNLVGISSACFGTQFPDNSFVNKPFHMFNTRNAFIEQIRKSGGRVIIKHDDKNKNWRIRLINLHIKYANELTEHVVVWNLNDESIGRLGSITLTFDKNFKAQ